MRWPFRHNAQAGQSEGMEQAKFHNEQAHQIDGHVDEILDHLSARMIANHLGQTIQRAVGGR